MIFPKCGKTLVIDDQILEAMPLLTLLGKNGVPTMYYSGNSHELPESPFSEIRLVFCDLKFFATHEEKSIVSNVLAILKALIAETNGPYILLVWSAHSADYVDALQEALNTTKIKPEFVLQLDKGDFFTSTDNGAPFDEIIDEISNLELDTGDELRIKELIKEKTDPLRSSKWAPVSDALGSIGKKLEEELKKANLFHLFVLWENTIAKSAIETVNSIYAAIPESISQDKKLRAMLFYLARYRLEQQLNTADDETKFRAALDSLNELFSYFYSEQVHELSYNQIEPDKIEQIREIQELSDAKFNQWKMLSSGEKGHHPGNVYLDADKLFRYHGLLVPDRNKKAEQYAEILEFLEKSTQIRYILIDLSSDCDIAQKKLFVSRVVPGVMVPVEEANGRLKESGKPDYIFKLSPVEFEGKNWYIAFNVNQMFAVDVDKLADENPLFAITDTYVISMKQAAATSVSKQGFASFG